MNGVDAGTIINSLIGSGPITMLLFYLLLQERKERVAMQAKLIDTLTQYAKVGEKTFDVLKRLTRNGKLGKDEQEDD